MPLSRKLTAEFIGTFWLVFGGCGSAVLAATFPITGIGFLGVALAFGLTVLTMAFRHRTHLRLSPESGRIGGPVGRGVVQLGRAGTVRARTGRGRHRCGSAVLYVIASGA